MALSGNDYAPGAVEEDAWANATPDGYKIKSLAPLSVSMSRKGLLSDENSPTEFSERRLSYINRLKLIKFGGNGNLPSPSTKFRQIAKERDQISRSVPSSTSQDLKKGFSYRSVRNFDCGSMLQMIKEWILNPLNMALLLWVTCVAVSGAILFLVMTGMLNHVIPDKSERDEWFEINNQILNALFTLMCLYQHPKRFHHLVLLFRWKPKDIITLREMYCKNGTYKPHEWTHMLVVILLLHLNCFAQYALCGLNLGYKRSQRPAIGVGICLSVAIAAPAIAGLYSILSPLGKDYNSEEVDCEAPEKDHHERRKSTEKRFSFTLRNEQKIVEERPRWKGNLFDLWEDIRVAYLSIFCTFCVFGWNMERLGFGNMYVHIATFLLFCTAPFWIFNLAAVNIENDTMRSALSVAGILLCFFGLLYGGFWRIQMRKRFNLPLTDTDIFCLRIPGMADCSKWLFCCWCSLAQEIRTASYYDIVENKFISKEMHGEGAHPPALTPLPRESSTAAELRTDSTSPLWRLQPPPLLVVRREDNDYDRDENKV